MSQSTNNLNAFRADATAAELATIKELTQEQELFAIMAMEAHGGSFVHHLALAWMHADLSNQVKLRAAFHDLLMQYHNTWGKK